MLRKLLCMSLIAVPAVGLSGCSTMWSSVGNFSNYMAEKTQFSSPLRGSKTQEVKFETAQNVDYAAATSDAVVADTVVYDNTDTQLYAAQSYSSDTTTYTPSSTSSDTPMFDADGNYIDTSPIPCPEDTYLTADNTCMFIEQVDYSSEFTQ